MTFTHPREGSLQGQNPTVLPQSHVTQQVMSNKMPVQMPSVQSLLSGNVDNCNQHMQFMEFKWLSEGASSAFSSFNVSLLPPQLQVGM